MGNDQGRRQPTEFGYRLLRELSSAGFPRPTPFAARAGISGATMNRLIYGDVERPNPDTLARIAETLVRGPEDRPRDADDLARAVLVKHNELLHAAGYQIGNAPPAHEYDPLAVKIDQMIGRESPLPAGDRDYIRTVVERVIQPYEKDLLKLLRRRTA